MATPGIRRLIDSNSPMDKSHDKRSKPHILEYQGLGRTTYFGNVDAPNVNSR